jgi:hypothetical protein
MARRGNYTGFRQGVKEFCMVETRRPTRRERIRHFPRPESVLDRAGPRQAADGSDVACDEDQGEPIRRATP